jgi:hypothetical protein
LLILFLAGVVAASFYFYDVAIKRNEKEFLQNSSDLKENFDQFAEEAEGKELNGPEWVESKPYETWTITSEDGLKLVGYFIPSQVPTTKTVILAHGYSSRGKDMGTFAKFYHEKLGYNVLMPDARGHGASEGDYIGFGWPERKDYLLWIRKVINTLGLDSKIALHGISMGGATVMMVSGEELPKQVKLIIEDCGYTSVYDELSYQLKRMFHLPGFPILPATSLLTKLRAGYSFTEASALKQVQKDRLPMLFIHGGKDTFVPTEMAYRLYDACHAEKELLIVEGAGHGLAYTKDKVSYEATVSAFLNMYMK